MVSNNNVSQAQLTFWGNLTTTLRRQPNILSWVHIANDFENPSSQFFMASYNQIVDYCTHNNCAFDGIIFYWVHQMPSLDSGAIEWLVQSGLPVANLKALYQTYTLNENVGNVSDEVFVDQLMKLMRQNAGSISCNPHLFISFEPVIVPTNHRQITEYLRMLSLGADSKNVLPWDLAKVHFPNFVETFLNFGAFNFYNQMLVLYNNRFTRNS